MITETSEPVKATESPDLDLDAAALLLADLLTVATDGAVKANVDGIRAWLEEKAKGAE